MNERPNEQKLDMKKHGGGMIMLVIVLVRSGSCGRSWNGKVSKKYLEAKKEIRRAVYQAKCKSERERFGNVMRRNDQECDVYKIAKGMVKTKQGIIDE